MKRKATISLLFIALFVVAFAICVSAKTVYLEEIPQELKVQNDSFTHFVVFEEEKYFTGSGATIDGLNTDAMNADMESAGIDASKIGSTYLTRYNIPAYMGETLITYANLNSMKTHAYFKGVCGYVQLAGTVNQVHDMNDCVSQLRGFDFGENSQVTKIPMSFVRYASKLKVIKNFPRNLTEGIESQAFCNCSNAFSGEIYINASSIGGKAFDNAIANVTGITFGPLTRSFAKESLSCGETGDVQIEYLEFQCDITQLTFNPSTDTGFNGTFYFGLNSESQRKPLNKLKCIILSNPAQANVVDGTAFQSFFDYDVFFNASAENPVYTSHALVQEETTVTYESLSKPGVKSTPCSRCIYSAKQELDPIYTSKGYAIKDNGTGIDGGFVVSQKALTEWQKCGGAQNVKFGIVIFNPKFLKEDAIFDANGRINCDSGALQVEFENLSYETFNFMISNFTDAHANLELVIAGYAVVDGDYSKAELNQKSYALTETPAVSTVTRGKNTLYTITISTVKKNQSVSSLPEYVVPSTNEEE